ncbi:MAG: 1-acylglycerol-3-phosphate O-acyltransferase [Psittacicella sp.]
MLAALRIILLTIISIIILLLAIVIAVFSFRNPSTNFLVARMFKIFTPILGVKIEWKLPKNLPEGSKTYIVNHQSNYDIFVTSKMLMKRTVTLGKKSLLFVPIFGVAYWLAGNILLDRENKSKAHSSLDNIIKTIHRKKLSLWIFPEGTRSKGQGLLDFKIGAFYTAVNANTPIIPIVISQYDIKLNRWNNGTIICEMLDEIPIEGNSKRDSLKLMKKTHTLMSEKIQELNKEANIKVGKINE